MEPVEFSPTTQTLLAPCTKHQVAFGGELLRTNSRLRGVLGSLVRMALHAYYDSVKMLLFPV